VFSIHNLDHVSVFPFTFARLGLVLSASLCVLPLAFTLRSSRVIGDFAGYRRLFAYLAAFGREGVGRQCGGKGGCIGL
jgi:hypothetical protein